MAKLVKIDFPPGVSRRGTLYETQGDVANVTFPCGYTLADDGDTLHVYYGAADSTIALAYASVRELLAWLDEHGRSDAPPEDRATTDAPHPV